MARSAKIIVPDQACMTPQDVMRTVGISRSQLFRIMREGRLDSYRPGPRTLRFRPQDVQRFIDSCMTRKAS